MTGGRADRTSWRRDLSRSLPGSPLWALRLDRGAGRAAAPSSRIGRPPMEIATCDSVIDDAGDRGRTAWRRPMWASAEGRATAPASSDRRWLAGDLPAGSGDPDRPRRGRTKAAPFEQAGVGAVPASSFVGRSPEQIHHESGRSPPGAAGPDTTPAARRVPGGVGAAARGVRPRPRPPGISSGKRRSARAAAMSDTRVAARSSRTRRSRFPLRQFPRRRPPRDLSARWRRSTTDAAGAGRGQAAWRWYMNKATVVVDAAGGAGGGGGGGGGGGPGVLGRLPPVDDPRRRDQDRRRQRRGHRTRRPTTKTVDMTPAVGSSSQTKVPSKAASGSGPRESSNPSTFYREVAISRDRLRSPPMAGPGGHGPVATYPAGSATLVA